MCEGNGAPSVEQRNRSFLTGASHGGIDDLLSDARGLD
jgi:hypothetical protein